ncbi:MAG TPA: LysM peptidoglycan-binding domain-containing protein, partial [Acidimicrobiales bacterium]|nr:LysM peptidoglycan-binding domain-containing protein [Acidimicrobiales bacterium]
MRNPRRRLAMVAGALATVTTSSFAGSTPAAAKAVTVRLGDTLSSIASHNHTTVAALAAANGIKDPNRIVAGSVLQLPGPPAPTATPGGASGPGPGANAPGAPLTVTVHLGDTLSSIASHNHTTVAALAAANGIKDPNRIVAGSVLQLPGPPVTAATPGGASGPGPGANAPGAPLTVTVHLGDTLSSIASHNHTTVAAL